MKQCIITAIFLPIYLFAQDTGSSYDQKLNQLRSNLGFIENAELDNKIYSALVAKLDSLGIKDEQLQDGFEWGGGKAGFEAYIKNNIDILLSDLSLNSSKSDSLINQIDHDILVSQSSIDSIKTYPNPVLIEEPIKPVEDLSLKVEQPIKNHNKIKIVQSKKKFLSGLKIGPSIGKAIANGTAFNEHTSYVEPMLSIRTPLGINIGPVLTSLGYETSKYSFEAPAETDTLTSYFGNGYGPLLFFDISRIIKFGGENFGKYFILGMLKTDHGSGFTGGYNLNIFLGSLPISLTISSRINIISLDEWGPVYWVSVFAGLGIDIR